MFGAIALPTRPAFEAIIETLGMIADVALIFYQPFPSRVCYWR